MTGEDYFLCYVRQHPDDLWMDAETTIRNYPFSDCEDDVFYIKDETVYLLIRYNKFRKNKETRFAELW